MRQLIPLWSPLHSADSVQQLLGHLVARLDRPPHEYSLWRAGDRVSAGQPPVLLIATGGTEGQALELLVDGKLPGGNKIEGDAAFTDRREPVLLLAHPFHNSLPAAMEILARLRQLGRRGKIIFVDDRQADFPGWERAWKIFDARLRLTNARLGLLGEPSDWLVASRPPLTVIHEHWGPQVVPIAMSEVMRAIANASDGEAARWAQYFSQRASETVEPTAGDMRQAGRVVAGIRKIVEQNHLDALTIRCFDLVVTHKTTGCLAVSALIDEGIIAGCEGDLPSALTMLWMNALTGETPFMANPQELDEADNTLWLAHCTVGSKLVENFRLRSHFESSLGVGIEGAMPLGEVTIARIGGEDLRQLFRSQARLIGRGVSPARCRTQIKLQLDQGVDMLLRRPLGNHLVLIKGRWVTILDEYFQLYADVNS